MNNLTPSEWLDLEAEMIRRGCLRVPRPATLIERILGVLGVSL